MVDKPITEKGNGCACNENKPSQSAVVRIEQTFCNQHRAAFGFPVIHAYGRDRKNLNRLIEQWGEDVTRELVPAFINALRYPGSLGYNDIRRIAKWGNVNDFCTCAPIIRRLQSTPGSDTQERTSSNVNEVAKAIRRK